MLRYFTREARCTSISSRVGRNRTCAAGVGQKRERAAGAEHGAVAGCRTVAAARVAPHGPHWVLGVHCYADPGNVRMNNSLSPILRRRSYQGVNQAGWAAEETSL
jgi:hypothetical protein